MAAKLWTSDRLRQPADNGLLDHHGCRTGAPCGHILIQDAGQQIGDGANRFSRSQHVAEEAAVLHAREPHHFRQFVESRFAHSLFGQRSAKQAAEFRPRLVAGEIALSIDVLEIFRSQFGDTISQAAKLVGRNFNGIHCSISRPPAGNTVCLGAGIGVEPF